MRIEIDKNSGFCFGVVYAIQVAEDELEKSSKLYCLGDIVHNNVEVERLQKKGLVTINHKELKQLKNVKVLIRAHGEPPETYKIAFENNIQLIDASCPVVLRLQNKIKIEAEHLENKGQVVIYGKLGHAEVNGLVGQTKNKAIVVEEIQDLDKVDYSKPITLFSQTTKSSEGFYKIQKEIKRRIRINKIRNEFNINNTLCSQVSSRNEELIFFSKKHQVIIFVSGKKSSNGKMLYEVCKSQNKNTYFVSNIDELKKEWFINVNSIGICGATSTPMWLMENISKKIKDFDL